MHVLNSVNLTRINSSYAWKFYFYGEKINVHFGVRYTCQKIPWLSLPSLSKCLSNYWSKVKFWCVILVTEFEESRDRLLPIEISWINGLMNAGRILRINRNVETSLKSCYQLLESRLFIMLCLFFTNCIASRLFILFCLVVTNC